MKQNIEEFFNTMIEFRQAMAKFNPEVEDGPTTMLQFLALTFIQESPNIPVSEVGKLLHLSKSSGTQLTSRLVKSGFVKRNEDKTDRRITRLSISVRGKRELVISKQKVLAKFEKVLSNLSENDLKELIRIQKKLTENLTGGK